MLHLILGEVGSGKTVLLDGVIAETVKREKRSFLIVPEQSTVAAERRMAEFLPSFSPLGKRKAAEDRKKQSLAPGEAFVG